MSAGGIYTAPRNKWGMSRVSLLRLFEAFDKRAEAEQAALRVSRRGPITAMARHLQGAAVVTQMHGILRINACRRGLEVLDS